MNHVSRWQQFIRRIAGILSPDVRVDIRGISVDRRTQQQRDRDLEAHWRQNVRRNVRQREMRAHVDWPPA